MSTTKARRTMYRGVWFRSQTEAFWAALLDAAGIPWRYEDGQRSDQSPGYRPDFYLPYLNQQEQPSGCWFEVKGPPPSPGDLKEAANFARREGSPVYLVQGTPGEKCLVWKWDARGRPIYQEAAWNVLLARLIILSGNPEFHDHPKNAVTACYAAQFEHPACES